MLTDKQKQQVQDAVRKGVLDMLQDEDNYSTLVNCILESADLPAAPVAADADADTDAADNAFTDCLTQYVDAYLHALQHVLQPVHKNRRKMRTLDVAAQLVQTYVDVDKNLPCCTYSTDAGAVPVQGVGVSNNNYTDKPSLVLVYAD